MGYEGVDGESSDASHEGSIDLNSPNSSGAGSGREGNSASQPVGVPETSVRRPSVNPATLALAGLMLLVIATVAVIANKSRKNSPPEPEEIVFEPVEVSLDEGSATLNARYTTGDGGYFHANGEDEIQLSIVTKQDHDNLYDVNGSLSSVMKVGVDGMDKGQICTLEILHEVNYTVQGTFSSAGCKFELSVTMAPTSSQLVSQGCSVDINLDPSGMYMAPLPGKLEFTKSLERTPSGGFSFYLHEVKLPSGVNCPSFSN